MAGVNFTNDGLSNINGGANNTSATPHVPQLQKKSVSKNYISITQGASLKIKELLTTKPESIGIKVGLKQKGCSGMMYNIEFAKEGVNVSKYDDLMVFEEFSIFVDPKIAVFIIGTTMDYISTDEKSGFEFVNPNEKGKCGCGESFYV